MKTILFIFSNFQKKDKILKVYVFFLYRKNKLPFFASNLYMISLMSIGQYPFFQQNTQNMTPKQRRKFTPLEDETLKKLVYEHGSYNWARIAELMPGRSPKQCRDRYCNYISAPHSNYPWTPAEDEMLLSLLPLLGPKWVEISRHIPGRSGNNTKNRWYKHLSKIYSLNKGIVKPIHNIEIEKEAAQIEQTTNSDPESLERIQDQYKISALIW